VAHGAVRADHRPPVDGSIRAGIWPLCPARPITGDKRSGTVIHKDLFVIHRAEAGGCGSEGVVATFGTPHSEATPRGAGHSERQVGRRTQQVTERRDAAAGRGLRFVWRGPTRAPGCTNRHAVMICDVSVVHRP
jgi:hypothetical protein